MYWQIKIENAMREIADGCSANPLQNNCERCPFTGFCSIIRQSIDHGNFGTPVEWFAERKPK